MRTSMTMSAMLIFCLFFLPWLRAGEPISPVEPPVVEEPAAVETEDYDAPLDSSRMLRVRLGDTVTEMDMETYLRGVLRAEMPASFAEEALKAQAIAARTYTLYKMENGGSVNHPDADACDDITCCKAYRGETEAAAVWGMSTVSWEEKIRRAVAETDGMAVLYGDAPVLAAFHSSSPGATQNVEDVWSSSLPYLRSVASPETADAVPNYHSTAVFDLSAFKERFISHYPTADLSGSPASWFTNMRQTATGTVISLQVGGVELTGSQLRALLELRSATFTISFTDSQVVFSVTGYGHGVGMSQYGANQLALEGKTCEEILTHYYTGTTVAVYPK